MMIRYDTLICFDLFCFLSRTASVQQTYWRFQRPAQQRLEHHVMSEAQISTVQSQAQQAPVPSLSDLAECPERKCSRR